LAGTISLHLKDRKTTHVYRKASDNLPTHIRGRATFYNPTQRFKHLRGYYLVATNPQTNKEEEFAVKFICNRLPINRTGLFVNN